MTMNRGPRMVVGMKDIARLNQTSSAASTASTDLTQANLRALGLVVADTAIRRYGDTAISYEYRL